MAEKAFQNKTKTIAKLIESGVCSEKDLLSLDMASALKLPDVRIQDLTIISELQINVKANKLFSYLSSGGESNE